MNPLLQVRDLTVTYGCYPDRQVTALKSCNLEIATGEVVGLLGQSGCGKTTLALSVLRLLPHSCILRGSIAFHGVNLLQLKECQLQRIRGARISMIYQEPAMALNPVMQVGDQVAEVLCAHKPMSRREARKDAELLLAKVGLSAESCIAEAYPHQLSGGQKQRVVIAQAIACNPELVIADEPGTALDGVTQERILALLQSLKDEFQLALLYITHDPAPLRVLADRVLVMEAGSVTGEGSPEQVLKHVH